MTRGRGILPEEEFRDWIDAFIIGTLLTPQEAASLTTEHLDILRANIRSEILFSDVVRQALTEKTRSVVQELRALG